MHAARAVSQCRLGHGSAHGFRRDDDRLVARAQAAIPSDVPGGLGGGGAGDAGGHGTCCIASEHCVEAVALVAPILRHARLTETRPNDRALVLRSEVRVDSEVEAATFLSTKGDVLFEEAVNVAGAITPVPGGVGPMTIACLMENTLIAARARIG